MAKLTSRVWVGYDADWGIIDILKSKRRTPPEYRSDDTDGWIDPNPDHFTHSFSPDVTALSFAGCAVTPFVRGAVGKFVPAIFSIDLDPPRGTQGCIKAERVGYHPDYPVYVYFGDLNFDAEEFDAFFGKGAAAKVDGKRVKIRLERVR